MTRNYEEQAMNFELDRRENWQDETFGLEALKEDVEIRMFGFEREVEL